MSGLGLRRRLAARFVEPSTIVAILRALDVPVEEFDLHAPSRVVWGAVLTWAARSNRAAVLVAGLERRLELADELSTVLCSDAALLELVAEGVAEVLDAVRSGSACAGRLREVVWAHRRLCSGARGED
jgi:hypothetical protein